MKHISCCKQHSYYHMYKYHYELKLLNCQLLTAKIYKISLAFLLRTSDSNFSQVTEMSG